MRPIAIVGIGCRFPGASGPAEYWQVIREGRFTVREVPEHRVELGFNVHDVFDPRPGTPGRIASAKYGFLDHPELFDPAPFGLSPRDAVGMEPQHRLIVEAVFDALQDAGIPPESLDGERGAVMIGHMAEDYSREQIAVLGEDRFRRSIDVWSSAGIARAALSGRVAFLLGLKGPSFTVDTACSSSLLTVHLACQSLWNGESDLAIAGGVNVFVSPEGMIALSRVGMLALDGKCKAFDDAADGFVRSEGAGVVVLKPLDVAVEAGDPIYAVIRGTGFSSDGRDGGHMMAPGRDGQIQAMRDAYARADVDPSTIDFVETHGTGTVIGDPVEIAALADVMAPGRAADRPLRVSSVKGNIGHAESASGIAGLIKAALAVHHRELPRQLHFETPSRAIPWDEVPIVVQTEHEAWPHDGVARAAVNSFGISGTNAHAILEQAPEPPTAARPTAAALYVLSAHSPEALRQGAHELADHVERCDARGALSLADLGYTLARRRSHRTDRLAIVADDAGELVRALREQAEGIPGPQRHTARCEVGRAPRIGMVFSGHGTHWLGMGRGLLRTDDAFCHAIDAWDAVQRPLAGWSVRDVLESDEAAWMEDDDRLQAIQAAMGVALAKSWERLGIRPAAVTGHSVGEIPAAHVAGALSLEDTVRLALARGRAIAGHAGVGAMAIVAAPASDVEADLSPRRERGESIWVAGRNAPKVTIVSGDVSAVERLLADLEAAGTFARRLPVRYASHCPAMEPAAAALANALDGLAPGATAVPFVSSARGHACDGDSLDAGYWAHNLRAAVQLDAAVGAMLDDGVDLLIEVSPHPALGPALAEIASGRDTPVGVVGSLRRDADEPRELSSNAGALFVRGAHVDWTVLHPQGRVVETPLYPYQRKVYWSGPMRGKEVDPANLVFGDLLGARARRFVPAAGPATAGRRGQPGGLELEYWEVDLERDSFDAEALGAGELVNLLARALRPAGDAALALGDVVLLEPLSRPTGTTRLQIAVEGPDGSGEYRLTIASRPQPGAGRDDGDGDWAVHATARGRRIEQPAPNDPRAIGRAQPTIDADEVYAALAASGLGVPEDRRVLADVTLGAHGARAGLVSAAVPGLSPLALQIDACLQLAAFADVHSGRTARSALERLASLTVADALDGAASVELADDAVVVRDVEGHPLLRAAGIALGAPRHAQPDATLLYEQVWAPCSVPAAGADAPTRWIVAGCDAPLRERITRALRVAGYACEERVGIDAAARAALPSGTGRIVAGLCAPLELRDAGLDAQADEATNEITAWLAAREDEPTWLVTRGARADAGASRALSARLEAALADAFAAQGLGHLDLSPSPDDHELASLVAWLGANAAADGVRLRGRDAERRVERVVTAGPEAPGSPDHDAAAPRPAASATAPPPFVATAVDGDVARGVELVETSWQPLDADEVRIAVHAAGLHTADALARTVGDAPAERAHEALPLGWECAGTVTAVGRDVHDLAPGDAVFGFAAGALASHATTRAALVARKPASIGFATAAGLPLAQVIGRFAIERIARLRRGERIAIHGGAGGIGAAAVALARRRGARVLATASTERRRRALADAGADLVLDSRSEGLRDALRGWAGEEGIDVVLDLSPDQALAGGFAIDVAAAGGRILGIEQPWSPEPAAMGWSAPASARARHVTLQMLDPTGLLRNKPDELCDLLGELADELAAGELEPPLPTVFDVGELQRALRYVAQGRHDTKVVVDLKPRTAPRVRPGVGRAASWLRDGTVVVTGTRGERLADWLEDGGVDVERRTPAQAADAVTALPVVGAVVAIDPARAGSEEIAGMVRMCRAAIDASLQFLWLVTPETSPDEPGARAALALVDGLAGHVRDLGFDALRLRIAPNASPAPLEPWLAGGAHALLLGPAASSAAAAEIGPDVGSELAALPAEERAEAIRAELFAQLCRVLHLGSDAAGALDWSRGASDLGLDSLLALEVKLALEARIGCEVALGHFFDGTPLDTIARNLAGAIARPERD